LNGEPPFRGETALSVAVQHLKNEPEPLTELRPDLPPLLCQIVHKMMAKAVDQRYQTAQEVLKDLKRLTAGGAGKGAAAVSETVPVKSSFVVRMLDASWKSHLIALVIMVVVLAGAAATLGWALRPHDILSDRKTSMRIPPAARDVAQAGETESRMMTRKVIAWPS
jgi:serine/threonine-protein kinase